MESIVRDVKWVGGDFEDRLFFASDYFDQMYECAVKLIIWRCHINLCAEYFFPVCKFPRPHALK